MRSYNSLFEAYFSLSGAQLSTELERVNEVIVGLKNRNASLNSGTFSKDAVPTFMNPADPLPTEISLHDYETTANESLKLLCAHLNNCAVKHIDLLPETREELIQCALTTTQLSKSQLKAHPYKAASAYLGSGRNIDQIAMEQMTGMMEVYRNTRNKVNYVKHLVFPEQDSISDFS
jgi:hypothetical protein